MSDFNYFLAQSVSAFGMLIMVVAMVLDMATPNFSDGMRIGLVCASIACFACTAGICVAELVKLRKHDHGDCGDEER